MEQFDWLKMQKGDISAWNGVQSFNCEKSNLRFLLVACILIYIIIFICTYIFKKNLKLCEMELSFCPILWFSNLYIFATYCRNPLMFQTINFVKYQISVWKDIGIRKFKFVCIGLLDYWTIGLLDYWTIGLLDYLKSQE